MNHLEARVKVLTARLLSTLAKQKVVSITLALLVLLGLVSVLLPKHPQAPRSTIARAPTMTAIPEPTHVPFVFSDWRVAYADKSNIVHAVTLDGATDLAGASLPDLTSTASNIGNTLIGPDGHTMAYSLFNVDIVDLSSTNAPMSIQSYLGNRIMWSPSGTSIATEERNSGNVSIISFQGGSHSVKHVTNQNSFASDILGWQDEHHVIVIGSEIFGSKAQNFYLSTLDIDTGVIHHFYQLPPHTSQIHFWVSPDGTKMIESTLRFRDNPFTPLVALIDTQSGTVTPLPYITQTTGAEFTSVAWSADNRHLAVSSNFVVNGNSHVWLLDTQTDGATKTAATDYPVAWVPGKNAFVESTSEQSTIGFGPYTISVVTLSDNGQTTVQQVTNAAYTFPCLGLIRTQTP